MCNPNGPGNGVVRAGLNQISPGLGGGNGPSAPAPSAPGPQVSLSQAPLPSPSNVADAFQGVGPPGVVKAGVQQLYATPGFRGGPPASASAKSSYVVGG